MKGSITNAGAFTEVYTEERCYITEVLNHSGQPEFSVARARVLPGVTTALHAVRDTEEQYYILSGRGEMEIGCEVVGEVQSGDLVVIPPGVPQRIRNIGEEDLVFLCFCTPRFEGENYEPLE
jgi:mannose-6-phosphate isomerase-like protein (cupin superfamily)